LLGHRLLGGRAGVARAVRRHDDLLDRRLALARGGRARTGLLGGGDLAGGRLRRRLGHALLRAGRLGGRGLAGGLLPGRAAGGAGTLGRRLGARQRRRLRAGLPGRRLLERGLLRRRLVVGVDLHGLGALLRLGRLVLVVAAL